MGKSIVFSVAGSGKTTLLVDGLSLDKRFLIVTFTDNNFANLRRKIVEKFGYLPGNIGLFTYFTFLHSFCYRPLLAMRMRTKGLNWYPPPDWTSRLVRTDERYYLDPKRRVYKGRLAKLLETQGALPEAIERIEKYYDVLCVDEVQDFAGHDFNFLATLATSSLSVLLVGDFYQHTFDTSRDGATNRTLHDDYHKYRARFKAMGLDIDDDTLKKSHRCPPTVCDFIRKNVGIDIESHGMGEHDVTLVEEALRAEELYLDGTTVKLFYKEHDKYGCYSQNWGSSKGDDHYTDVCVVLNDKTMKAYKTGTLKALTPTTRNKFYVACSRTRANLYLVPEKLYKKFKLP
ncbi:AAA family ATPase [Duganella sp. HH101]|uniref:AAA family ATPase n=1 Tax=Duganella sp. HH101 TaxID=1781066 RepID=UPI0008745DDB|nr:AAA family ATPase [Duganella sp. HH101]OFA05651.1 UvrD/REP helicase [Duganella sp. HH101]